MAHGPFIIYEYRTSFDKCWTKKVSEAVGKVVPHGLFIGLSGRVHDWLDFETTRPV